MISKMSKDRFFYVIAILLIASLFANSVVYAEGFRKKRVLVFSLTKGFRHQSISNGISAIRLLGQKHRFDVDTSENVNSFTDENLRKYQLLVFLNPTGTKVFSDNQKAALQKYVNAGGGVVGIHAATDFCYEWEWYGRMMGAYFESHPKVQRVKLDIVDKKDNLTKGLPENWVHNDEWYNFKNFNPDVKVIIKADETSYKGGKMNNNHPVSWYHEFDGGRVFYTGMGHTAESYTDVLFLKHLWAGMEWTMK